MDGDDRPGAGDDRLGPERLRRSLPTSTIVALIENLLETMYAVGDDAEATYARALAELQANPDEAIVALARLEGECVSPSSYPRRWALIYAASQLDHAAVLPLLRQVVLTPIPEEESSNPHSFSTVKQETVLRCTAIEGVGALARRGNERATDSLFEFLSIQSISIRRASVQALLAMDSSLYERIADHLPREQRYLLDIKPVAVADVAQIVDPTRHLREGYVPDKPRPPDPEREGGQDRPQTAPRIGG